MELQNSRQEANRANAQLSTGPKTHEGKSRSRLNALRHGLTSQIVVMPSEDLAAYQSHLQSFTTDFNPQGSAEAHLVQALADISWRLNRVAAIETNILTLAAAHQPNPVDHAPPQVQSALATAAAYETQSKAIANLSLHSQRLSRQFEKTLLLLRDVQTVRRAEEQQQLTTLLDIMEIYKAKGEPYNPSDDGFVFSEPQIRTAMQLRSRQNRARSATM